MRIPTEAGVFFSSNKGNSAKIMIAMEDQSVIVLSLKKFQTRVKSIGDPDVQSLDGNKVTNSFLHNNLFAGYVRLST